MMNALKGRFGRLGLFVAAAGTWWWHVTVRLLFFINLLFTHLALLLLELCQLHLLCHHWVIWHCIQVGLCPWNKTFRPKVFIPRWEAASTWHSNLFFFGHPKPTFNWGGSSSSYHPDQSLSLKWAFQPEDWSKLLDELKTIVGLNHH